MKVGLLLCLTWMFQWTGIFCQTVSFSAFEGTAYYIPKDYLLQGYNAPLSYFEVLGTVTMKELAIPKTNQAFKYFPGVTIRDQFGIIFNSKMDIPKTGCYEIFLESDDGSRFWIEDKEIINNDGHHKMSLKRDTITLAQGSYPVKVWYYNAFPSEFGLILKVNFIQDSFLCKSGSLEGSPIVLNSVLFEFDASALTRDGKAEMDRICTLLAKKKIKSIRIEGHTDMVGDEKYNLDLSQRRAQEVLSYMKSKLQDNIVIQAIGKGSSEPISNLPTASAQALNRRVEIYIE